MDRSVEGRLAYQLAQTEHALRVALERALRDLGVTVPQWSVLNFLAREPGLSAADLARRSFISEQAVAGILARLERAGLVAREPHPTHRRILRVMATPTGIALAERCDQRVAHAERRLRDALTEGEREQMADLLARCRAAVRDTADAPSRHTADTTTRGG